MRFLIIIISVIFLPLMAEAQFYYGLQTDFGTVLRSKESFGTHNSFLTKTQSEVILWGGNVVFLNQGVDFCSSLQDERQGSGSLQNPSNLVSNRQIRTINYRNDQTKTYFLAEIGALRPVCVILWKESENSRIAWNAVIGNTSSWSCLMVSERIAQRIN